MIESIKIQGLYDRFTYDIKLNEDVTIITGPNGYGKTTLLNIISWLNDFKYKELYNLTFKEITIKTKNKDYVINKRKRNLLINGEQVFDEKFSNVKCKKNLKYTKKDITNKSEKIYSYNNEGSLLNSLLNSLLIENIDNLNKSEFEKFVENYRIKNNIFLKNSKNSLHLNRDMGKIYFIQEQRLIKGNYKHIKDVVDVIENLPNRFKKIINDVSNNYSSVSNNLDSTYPERLFQTEEGITEDEYKHKIKDMREKFDKLNKYDISEMKDLYKNVSFKKEFSKALKVYFDDFDKKYKEYEELIERLDLFVEIINSKLRFKKVKVSRLEGIKVIDDNGNNISLKDLSSGEKQEIALFFELIFRTDKGTTLLIDEPEISLHILWQKRFMNDLISVAKKMELKAIVATHSPQIIGAYRDKQIDLGKLYFGGLNNGSNGLN